MTICPGDLVMFVDGAWRIPRTLPRQVRLVSHITFFEGNLIYDDSAYREVRIWNAHSGEPTIVLVVAESWTYVLVQGCCGWHAGNLFDDIKKVA